MEAWDGTRLENLKRLLWEEWDPIGINAENCAQDEYDAYAVEVERRLERRRPVEEIAAYLKWVQVYRMGIADNPTLDNAIARKAMDISAIAD